MRIVSIVRILFYAVRTKGQEKEFVQKALMVLEFESGANATRGRSAAAVRATDAAAIGEARNGFSDLVHQPVPLQVLILTAIERHLPST